MLPIEKLEDNLWCVEGALPNMALKRRMTVVKLSDGRLVIHSAILLNREGMAELERWGEPAFLIVPLAWHRLDAAAYAQRYPTLRVLCPPEAETRVRKVVQVDGHLDALPQDPSLWTERLSGVRSGEAVLGVRSGERTSLVFTDILFNQPHLPGAQGFVMKMLGSTGGPRLTRIARLTMVNDRRALQEHLLRLATTPTLRRLIMSHGQIIDDHPAGVLRAVAQSINSN
jgi:hypothetical protein